MQCKIVPLTHQYLLFYLLTNEIVDKYMPIHMSLTNTLQRRLSYPACLIGVQPKRKGNDDFDIVECRPTCRSG